MPLLGLNYSINVTNLMICRLNLKNLPKNIFDDKSLIDATSGEKINLMHE